MELGKALLLKNDAHPKLKHSRTWLKFRVGIILSTLGGAPPHRSQRLEKEDVFVAQRGDVVMCRANVE